MCQEKDRKLGRDVAINVLPGEFAKEAGVPTTILNPRMLRLAVQFRF